MMTFDPLRERETLRGWAIARELGKKRDTYEPDSALGSAARSMLDNVIYGWLVGLHDEVRPLLMKSLEWLEASRAKDEQPGDPPAFFAMLREVAHALALWMLEGRSDREAFARVLALHEKAWEQIRAKRPFPDAEALEHYVGAYLRDCIQARAWERGIAAYEGFGGAEVAEAADLDGDAAFGAWACRNRLPQPPRRADYVAAAERAFGRGFMAAWIGRGHLLSAATWLKTIYWESGATPTPEETFLKAYDLMPGVKRPPMPAGR
jgi:hypothetical protein